jgi:LemA protein
MKKYTIWIVLGVLVLIVIMGYNGLVGSRETVNKAWANVETSYQRRADLIPNLVNTVKGAADFEKSTLTAVMEARSKATSIRIDPNNITPEKLQEYQAAQAQVGGALSRLLAVAENYPQLKATQNFSELQAQLEGTENRINEARRQYNEAAQSYNTSRSKFPRVMIAGLFGFKERAYFESDKGAEKAPTVKF